MESLIAVFALVFMCMVWSHLREHTKLLKDIKKILEKQ